jgi:hypothetical protein
MIADSERTEQSAEVASDVQDSLEQPEMESGVRESERNVEPHPDKPLNVEGLNLPRIHQMQAAEKRDQLRQSKLDC